MAKDWLRWIMVDTLVKRQLRVELKSLENTLVKLEKKALPDALAARLSEV